MPAHHIPLAYADFLFSIAFLLYQKEQAGLQSNHGYRPKRNDIHLFSMRAVQLATVQLAA